MKIPPKVLRRCTYKRHVHTLGPAPSSTQELPSRSQDDPGHSEKGILIPEGIHSQGKEQGRVSVES